MGAYRWIKSKISKALKRRPHSDDPQPKRVDVQETHCAGAGQRKPPASRSQRFLPTGKNYASIAPIPSEGHNLSVNSPLMSSNLLQQPKYTCREAPCWSSMICLVGEGSNAPTASLPNTCSCVSLGPVAMSNMPLHQQYLQLGAYVMAEDVLEWQDPSENSSTASQPLKSRTDCTSSTSMNHVYEPTGYPHGMSNIPLHQQYLQLGAYRRTPRQSPRGREAWNPTLGAMSRSHSMMTEEVWEWQHPGGNSSTASRPLKSRTNCTSSMSMNRVYEPTGYPHGNCKLHNVKPTWHIPTYNAFV